MPRYYFHIVTPLAVIRDREGTELPCLDDAREEAIMDARSLMSDAILDGRDISSRRIEIHDATDALLIIPFSTTILPEG